jgi:8-oxo-dGTP pyrophosphatase MutT (NUDIX family)
MRINSGQKYKSIEELAVYLEEKLKGALPGIKSQLKLSPHPPTSTLSLKEAAQQCLKGAVLLLLYPRKEGIHLVLIRRSSNVRLHQNQISFPGGQMEKNESKEKAALREAREELGLKADNLKVLGYLTPLYVQTSNYCIFPVVAITSNKPVFEPSPQEVAEIIEVPLEHFLDPRNLCFEVRQLRGKSTLVPFFSYNQHQIWGATAMILSEFLDILKGN